MSDDPIHRPLSLDTRVTILEVEMREHLRRSTEIHTDQATLIAKLDERADKSEKAFAVLLAKLSIVVSVAIFAANLLGPVILRWANVTP